MRSAVRKLLAGALVLVAPALGGCTARPTATSTPTPDVPRASSSLAARHGFAGKTPEEILETLDRDPRIRPLPLSAQVGYELFTIREGTESETFRLTNGMFFLAIAPYRTRDQFCHTYNAGTRQGELVHQPVTITITDSTGRVLVSEETETGANGFVSYWVPRDISGTVRIVTAGRSGQVPFTSAHSSPTCLMNLKVS